MAITVVQTSSKQQGLNVTTKNFNFTNVVAGNTIFVAVFYWKSGGVNSLISVSDGDGRYTRDNWINSASQSGVAIFRLNNASNGTHSITIDCNTSGHYLNACAIEVSGSGQLMLDANSFSRGSSTTPTSGATKTTATANEFILAVTSAEANQASITVEVTSPTWTQSIEDLDFSTSIAGEVDQKIVSATGAYTANWTLASSANWASIICTYRELTSSGEYSVVF